MVRSSRRGPWLPEEDRILIELVQTQGPNNWVRISQQVQYRSPKQCRERYHQNLKPSLNHEPISAEEGLIIEQMVQDGGKRWAEIARRLGNRSDNTVKNWWNGSMNRRKRNPTPQGTSKYVANRIQPIPIARPAGRPYPTRPHDMPPVHDHSNELPGPQSFHWMSVAEAERATPRRPEHFGGREMNPEAMSTPIVQSPHRLGSVGPSTIHHGPVLPEPRLAPSKIHFPAPERTRGELQPSRLPPPSILPPEWHPRHGHVHERPLVSPAMSETSQALSFKHPPSLVSDNLSNYSVSPKTATSPRPGVLAPVDATSQWPSVHSYPGASESPTTKDSSSNLICGSRAKADRRMHVSSLLD